MGDLTVVQHNDLIGSSYRLSIDEMRLINLALTKIDSRSKNIGVIEISPDEFAEMHMLPKGHIWDNMRKSIISLMNKCAAIETLDAKNDVQVRLINWLDEAIYYKKQSNSSKIQLEFSRKIEPYLFELSGNFTKIDFMCASRLSTPFSLRLYQWLTKGCRVKNGRYYDLTMTLDEIKSSAQLRGTYPRWDNFKCRVIDPAIDAINQKTNLSVSYSVTTRGRKVHSLTFTYIDGMQKDFSEYKPVRPRLLRRPKVKKGSHEEGEWQKANYKILSLYQEQLRAWDETARLTITDLKKLIEYSRLFGQKVHEIAVDELLARQSAAQKDLVFRA